MPGASVPWVPPYGTWPTCTRGGAQLPCPHRRPRQVPRTQLASQTGKLGSPTQSRILGLARKHWSFKAEVLWGLKCKEGSFMVERSRSRVLRWFWHPESYSGTSLTWILLILAALWEPTSFAVTEYHRGMTIGAAAPGRWGLLAGGGVWCLIPQFSPSSESPAFSPDTTHTCRFSHSCSASFLCASGSSWPFDFVEPHIFSSCRPIRLAPIHCSHLSKPESISALDSFSPWSHYREVQSPASLLKAQ